MDAFQENPGYNGELVDQAFTILTNNGGPYPLEQITIIQGAAQTICNHIGGVNGLTKVECQVLIGFTCRVIADEQLPFLNAQANAIRTTRPEGSMTDADIEFLDFTTGVADRVAAAGFADLRAQGANQGLDPFDRTHQDRVPGTEHMTAMSATHTNEAGTFSRHEVISNVVSADGAIVSTSSFTMTSSVTSGMFPSPYVPVNLGNSAPLDFDNMAQEALVVPQGFVLEGIDLDVEAIGQAMEFDAMNAPQRHVLEGVDIDAPEAQQGMDVDQVARYAYLDADGLF